MQTITQRVSVSSDREIRFKAPDQVPAGETVEVMLVLPDSDEEWAQKKALMAEAMNDPLFVQDLEEIAKDFKWVDLEGW